MVPQLSINPVGHLALVALLAAGLFALMLVGPAASRTTPRRRAVLAGLRVGVFLLVVAAMLRPTLVYTEKKQRPATLLILADRSRSMQVADAFGNRTRWDALRSTLRDAEGPLSDLARHLEVKLYTFDADAQEVPYEGGKIELGDKADGQQTAIGWVLDEVLRQHSGKRLAGVIVLSDGAVRAVSPRDVPPQVPAGRLRDLGHPLYALAFGQARGLGQARDVAVRDFAVSPTVFVKNQLSAGGSVRVDGFVDQPVPVQLLFETSPGKMEIVGTKPLRAMQDGDQLPVEFDYVPQVPGEYKVTLRAAPQPGELVTTNNEISTFVTVLKGGINVLYLEGQLRDETAFLRRSLDASPDVKVDFVWLRRGGGRIRPPNLAERFKPGKYDVYILGDLDASVFEPGELEALSEAVDRGAGLIMLGGFHSFGPGGYAETPLAGVLPLQMDKLERQRFDDPIRRDVHWPGPVKMRPAARRGTSDYITRLTSEGNAELWEKLPPLDGANKFRGLKPAAHVLLEGPSGQPLLLAQEAGSGRSLAFAGDSTWKWTMHGYGDAHKRFWRQVVLWLARKDELTDGNVSIALQQRRYGPAARVDFTAKAHSPQGEPVVGADFEAEVELPDGSRRPLALSRQSTSGGGEEMLGSFLETQAPGDYTIRVTARQGGESLGSAQARFLVYEQDLEMDNSAADHTLLESLAAMTGGETLAPEQLPSLLERLKQVPEELQIEVQTKATLWDSWPLFLLLALLASTEWFLRKKWGLV